MRASDRTRQIQAFPNARNRGHAEEESNSFHWPFLSTTCCSDERPLLGAQAFAACFTDDGFRLRLDTATTKVGHQMDVVGNLFGRRFMPLYLLK